MEPKNIFYIGTGLGMLFIAWLGWFIFFSGGPTPTQQETTTGGALGTSENVSVVQNTGSTNTNQPISTGLGGTQKIFRVVDGPVAGATLIYTTNPTTTIARYVQQNNGHVLDLTLDSPGAIPKAVSNTTIPGIIRALWLGEGRTAILQYVDDGIVKTVSMGLLEPASTSTTPTRIQFLPDNIADIAASPDGTEVVYLLKTSGGVDGYTASSNGSGSEKLFSLPLSEVLVSWPAQTNILVQTKSAAGVPGMVFSVRTSSGVVTPLVYAPGVTAIADRTFDYVIYQTAAAANGTRSTYVRNVADGTNAPLSFDPAPERCVWSIATGSTLYCAAPLQYTDASYLDLWHQGAASAADSIFMFNVAQGRSSIVAAPGSSDGGVQSDVAELSVSPNDDYLLFITRGDHTLWGVRLTQ